MSGTRRPWWNRTIMYVAMVLVMLAMRASGLRQSKPSPITEEQAVVQAMDARLTPANVSTALLQHPALALGLTLMVLVALLAWVAGIVLLLRRFVAWKARSSSAKSQGPPRVWSIGDVARVVIIGLFAAHLLPFLQMLLRSMAGRAVGDLHAWMLVSMVLLDGAALAAVLVLASGKTGQGPKKTVGWRTNGWSRDCRQGLLAYVALLPVLTVAMLIVVGIAARFQYTPPPEALLGLFLNESRWPILLAATLFVCLLGPIVEETVFRGVLYAAVRRRWGVRWGIVISGGCFAALHTNPVGLLPIWLLGGTLAWLYETTGSLVPSITLHVVHNTVMMACLWFIKTLLAAIG